MATKINGELIKMANKPFMSREKAKLERYESGRDVKINNGSLPEDFFIGNSSKAIIKAALRDHKPFQLWPDQVLSFNKGNVFGINVAAVAHHIKTDILEPICAPEFEKLASGEADEFNLVDYLQHKGYLGVGGKSEIPEDTYLMFSAQKINALAVSELVSLASSEKTSSVFSVTRYGSDWDDWD